MSIKSLRMKKRTKHLFKNRILSRIVFQSQYRLVLGCITLASIAVIAFLSTALLHSGPRVRLFELNNEQQLTVGSVVTIVFDRPLKNQDYSSAVSFNPSAAFDTKVQGKTITLTLKSNLQQRQQYSVAISPTIYDQNGNVMRKQYVHTFKTLPARYAYLKRNYELDPATGQKVDDVVYLEDLEGKSERLFSALRIRAFRINDRFAVVAAEENGSDALYVIDLLTRDNKKEALYVDGTVRELAVSARGDVLIYTVEPKYTPDNPKFFETNAYQLNAINLKTSEKYVLSNAKQEPLYAESVQLSSDGQYVLYKDLKGSFQITSPFNDYEPVLLGAHTRAYGFDTDMQNIIFEDEGTLSTYRLSDSLQEEQQNDDVLLGLSIGKGGIFLQVAEYQSPDFITKIKRKADWVADATVVWESKNSQDIVRTFSDSYDQKYLGVATISDGCQFDDYGIASECEEIATDIYDIDKRISIKKVDGFGLVWLP